MTLLYALIILGACFVLGVFTSMVAVAKKYQKVPWFFAGFFFWFVALIAIVGMPIKTQEEVIDDPSEKRRW